MAKDVRSEGMKGIGYAEAYALARVVPYPGGQVTCSAVFNDYRQWCARQGWVPLREAEFVTAFEELARDVGIPLRQRGGNLSFLDVALSDTPATP